MKITDQTTVREIVDHLNQLTAAILPFSFKGGLEFHLKLHESISEFIAENAPVFTQGSYRIWYRGNYYSAPAPFIYDTTDVIKDKRFKNGLAGKVECFSWKASDILPNAESLTMKEYLLMLQRIAVRENIEKHTQYLNEIRQNLEKAEQTESELIAELDQLESEIGKAKLEAYIRWKNESWASAFSNQYAMKSSPTTTGAETVRFSALCNNKYGPHFIEGEAPKFAEPDETFKSCWRKLPKKYSGNPDRINRIESICFEQDGKRYDVSFTHLIETGFDFENSVHITNL